ncbi:hypothetical protein BJ878DRAFT_567303 [Calycina marina]|uniref:Inositolphosphotransferase Aur1/Ipt1 domain-containing protein n=1 Tax=Calycina marina TaxID=1763456 RepID=A0A9P8CF30_9HELO|nr:hypothetical protein BJ878DRAFT_567303 [Calycina marina]
MPIASIVQTLAIAIISIVTLWLTRNRVAPEKQDEETPLISPSPTPAPQTAENKIPVLLRDRPHKPNPLLPQTKPKPKPKPKDEDKKVRKSLPQPDNTEYQNTEYHDSFLTRLLRRWPFLIEVIYCNAVFLLEAGFRRLTVLYINSNATRKITLELLARSNALRVLAFEQQIPLAFELLLQTSIRLYFKSWVMQFLCLIYLAQPVIAFAFLAYSFITFRRSKYQRIRRTMVIFIMFSSIIMSVYRCTSPRFMPAAYGYLDPFNPIEELPDPIHGPIGELPDPIHGPIGELPDPIHGPIGDPPRIRRQRQYDDPVDNPDDRGPGIPSPDIPVGLLPNDTELSIGAMPSVHFGHSIPMSFSIVVSRKEWWIKGLAVLYPVFTLIVLVGVGEDWILDCVVGALVMVASWYCNKAMHLLQPAENAVFHLLKSERPE